MSLPDIIARLERATGADRELDALVWGVIDARPLVDAHGCLGKRDPDDALAFDLPPRYTASLDAALTLVPEGCGVLLAIGRGSRADVSIGYLGEMNATWPGGGTHDVPAIALCIAALRARHADPSEPEGA